jgi:hypothetical protein
MLRECWLGETYVRPFLSSFLSGHPSLIVLGFTIIYLLRTAAERIVGALLFAVVGTDLVL